MDHRFEIVLGLAAVVSVVCGLVAKRSMQAPIPTQTQIEAPIEDVVHEEPLVKYKGDGVELKNDARW